MTEISLQDKIISEISIEDNIEELLTSICSTLNSGNTKFTWVGFYFMNNENRMLYLGPYVGKPTEHTKIPYGKGICGQVADSGATYLAEDVLAEGNYIACSHDVRSEIVIPIYNGQQLVSQLDIDSNEVNAFLPEDRLMLETICIELGKQKGEALETLAKDMAKKAV